MLHRPCRRCRLFPLVVALLFELVQSPSSGRTASFHASSSVPALHHPWHVGSLHGDVFASRALELIRFEMVVVMVRGEALTRHLGQSLVAMVCVTLLISSHALARVDTVKRPESETSIDRRKMHAPRLVWPCVAQAAAPSWRAESPRSRVTQLGPSLARVESLVECERAGDSEVGELGDSRVGTSRQSPVPARELVPMDWARQ